MPNIKRIALITGASSGIGKETARIFLENGFVVLNFDKNLRKMSVVWGF